MSTKLLRRRDATRLLGVAITATVASPAVAQSWPSQPIKLVVPYPPGQSVDVMARLLAGGLRDLLGQPVVVENRPGASGTTGVSYVVHATPDGYTLGVGASGTLGIAPSLYPRLDYDPTKDITPISQISSAPLVIMVAPASPLRTLADLVALARSQPGKVFYGSSGNGSTQHLSVALFAGHAGLEMVHVPYRGSSAALNDLMAGHITMTAETLPVSLEFVRTGQLRGLAVTSLQRSPFLPDIPTLQEGGFPGLSVIGANGIIGPRGLPTAIVTRVDEAIRTVVATADFTSRMMAMALPPDYLGPDGFRAAIARDVPRWREAVEAAGVQADP